MRDSRQKIISIVIGAVLLLVAVAGIIIEENIRKNTPSKKHAGSEELEEMFGIDDENKAVVLNDIITEGKGYMIDDKLYLDYEFVRDNINSRFYWDNNENILIYTTPTQIIKADVASKEYYVNKTKETTDYSIVKTDGKKVFVNIEYVKNFTNMEYEEFEAPDRVCIVTNFGQEYTIVKPAKSAQVRIGSGIKKDIIADVTADDELVLLDADENQDEDWYRVSVNGGLTGYIKKSAVGDETETKRENDYKSPEYTSISRDFTVCLGWHMVTNEAANNTLLDVTANAKGMNVISPTWFRISDNGGNISSLADSTYVDRAHQLGLEVWAMVDDQSPDSKDTEVFPYTSKRENLENALLSAAIQYNLDGINLDFEYITKEIGEDYIQFIREFSVKCRNNGIVLSVDNYASASQYEYFNCEEQGNVVDYVVIMGYDEHSKSSKEAGSVASLGWVKDGIENMVKSVPSSKVINAIPFYTRIWEESNGELNSRALGMEDAWSEMNANGAQTAWIEDFGQTYGEYVKDGITYRCWLEDSKSVEARAKLISEYKLAGIATWRLGFETDDVWNTLVKYTN